MPHSAGRRRPLRTLLGHILLVGVLLALGACSSGTAPPVSNTATPASTVVPGSGGGPTTGPSTTSTTANGPTTASTQPPTVRIGVILPQTGELAAQGEESLRGLSAATDEVNAGGGIRGLEGARLELVLADSQSDPERAATEAERLCGEEGVAALVVPVQSTIALPVTEAAERLRVPVLVGLAAADEVTEQGLAFTFRLCPKAEWYARDQVYFLRWAGGGSASAIRSVALLHEDGAFGQATAEAQKKYLTRMGIQVALEITYPADQPDLHQEVLAVKGSDADAVLTATYVDDALLVADALNDARVVLPVVDAGGGFADAEFTSRLGQVAEGLCTVTDYAPGILAADVEQRLRTGTDHAPTAATIYSYQAVWVLADALERAHSADPATLQRALTRTRLTQDAHLVLPQTVLTFDGSGQNSGATHLVMQVQDGGYRVVWPASRAEVPYRSP